MRIFAKKMLTPAGWQENCVLMTQQGKINALLHGVPADLQVDTLVPGFFDTHNHGGYGFDSCSGTQAELRAYLQGMLRCGVTDTLLTVSTGPVERILQGIALARWAMTQQQQGALGGTRVRGVHMEGPFLNPARGGAMAVAYMLPLDPARFEAHFGAALDIVRLVTIAPELPGGRELTAYLRRRGIVVQAGHTDATFAQAQEAFCYGVQSLCHTFNAARPLHHREPGIVGAALLNDNIYCEAIGDLLHLHGGTLQLLHRLKGPSHMVLVSDSTMPNGMPDGVYESANHKVIVEHGVARVPAGNLSGGTCYLDQSVRNLIALGIPAADAYTMASRTPAQRLGMTQTGLIAPGAQAHLVGLNAAGQVCFTVVDEQVTKGAAEDENCGI